MGGASNTPIVGLEPKCSPNARTMYSSTVIGVRYKPIVELEL